MADQAERVILEAEDNVTPITSKANASLDAFERKATSSGEKMVRINDQTRSSVQRLITSLEKQTEVYGKSGVDRLIVQRDQLLQRYQREPAAINAITASYERMIAVEKKAADAAAEAERKRKEAADAAARQAAGQRTAGAFADPWSALRGGVGNVLTEIGPMGGAVLGGAAALATFAKVGWDAARSLGEYGTEIENTSIRMGLTTKEVGQFRFAAKAMGSDITVIEGTMRKLSQGLSDGSEEGKKTREALRDIGVESRNVDGTARPMSEVFLQISERLKGIHDPATRDAEAVRLFGRAGIEALPAILGLSDGIKRARELGLGASEEEVARWKKYHETLTEADAAWDRLVRHIKEPIAATVIIAYKWSKSGDDPASPSVAGSTRGGGPNDGYDEQDLPYLNDLAHNPNIRRYAPGAQIGGTPGAASSLQQRMLGDALAQSSAAKGLRNRMGGGLEGAKSTLDDLKHAYDEAKNSAQALAQASGVLPSVADEAWQKLKGAEESYKRQGDLVKELEKDESKRLAVLEKEHALMQQHEGFYQIGSGSTAGVVTQSQIWAANTPVRGVPSLYRRGEQNPYATVDAINGESTALSDLKPGLQVVDGQVTFVADSSKLGTPAGQSGAVLDARMKGDLGLGESADKYRVAQIGAGASYATRMAELHGKDDEIGTAQTVAAIRARAIQAELNITGDVNRARTESLQNELTMREKIAEVEQKRIDNIKHEVEPLLHTLFTNPGKFPTQLGSTVRDAALRPIEGMLAGTIASSLGGVFGHSDPVRVSTDQNTMATMQNTQALMMMAGAVAGGGSAAAGGFSPIGGGFSPMMISGGGAAMPTGGMSGGGFSSGGSTGGGLRLPGMGGGGFSLANLKGLGSMIGIGGDHMVNLGGGAKSSAGAIWSNDPGLAGLGDKIQSIAQSPAGGAAGMFLGQRGLVTNAGTWTGAAQAAAGGALIGDQLGGPLGAAAGASFGFEVSMIEKLAGVKTLQQTAHDDIKSVYGVDIPTQSGTIKQVVEMAKSQFGGSISVAVRSPNVRQLVMLYSEATGQHMPLSASTPYGATLVQQGGGLFQQASFQGNAWHSYQSNIPVLGGMGGSQIPTPTMVSLNISGSDAANFMTGQYVTPQFVADQSMAAQGSGYNRAQIAANGILPGLTVA